MPDLPAWAASVFLTAALAVYHFIANGEHESQHGSPSIVLRLWQPALALDVWSPVPGRAGPPGCLPVLRLGLCASASPPRPGPDVSLLVLLMQLACSSIADFSTSPGSLWLHGYLPVDASGDWAYQAVDVVSLVLVLWLLHSLFFEKKHTYQEKQDQTTDFEQLRRMKQEKDARDTFPATPVVLACLVLAAIFHADMNARPVFDTLWMAGLFISAVAVLPQLWLISKTGGKVEPLTSHYIAAMAISRALSGVFMWHARFDITCDPWVGGFNHAIWVILGANALHMLLLGDFGYYYIKTVMKGGLTA
eukprot:s1244_g2.t1